MHKGKKTVRRGSDKKEGLQIEDGIKEKKVQEDEKE